MKHLPRKQGIGLFQAKISRGLLLTLLAILTLNPIFIPRASAQNVVERPKFEQSAKIETIVLDRRAKILKEYLAKYNSPLENNAQDFIDAADKYALDWKLVPAIAGVESTFGKFTPGGCNSWGWGVYGDQALKFKSCRDGIYTVSEGLRKNYLDQGLLTPAQINRKYAASPTWGSKVSYFIADLDKFAKDHPLSSSLTRAPEFSVPQVAASSGQLALTF